MQDWNMWFYGLHRIYNFLNFLCNNNLSQKIVLLTFVNSGSAKKELYSLKCPLHNANKTVKYMRHTLSHFLSLSLSTSWDPHRFGMYYFKPSHICYYFPKIGKNIPKDAPNHFRLQKQKVAIVFFQQTYFNGRHHDVFLLRYIFRSIPAFGGLLFYNPRV